MRISDDIFDSKLIESINESPASHLLTIPGVYELVAEYYNNDILAEIEMDEVFEVEE